MSGKLRNRKRKRNMAEDSISPSVPCGTRLLQAVSQRNILEVFNILESTKAKVPQGALNTALFQAAEQGQKRILQLLISHGANVNKSNSKGHTPLMAASEHGFLDLVKILFESGANIDSQNKVGKTALMLGVEKACSISLLNFFLSRKCRTNVNLQDNNGRTALMIATELCDFVAIEALIYQKGTRTDLKDKSNQTALDIANGNGIGDLFSTVVECNKSERFIPCLNMAVRKKNINLVKALLDCEIGQYNIDLPDLDDLTPLMLALSCINQFSRDSHIYIQIVHLLLKAGANVNKGERKSKWTPLLYASKAGSLEAVKTLVEHGACVNTQTVPDKLTALIISAQSGNCEITDFLIKSKAKLDLTNDKDETALILALKKAHKGCAKLLVDGGAETNDKAFMLAVQFKQHRLFPSVSEKLADQNTINELLICAIIEESCDLVSYLLDNGAEVSGKGHSGRAPLVLAAKNIDLVRLLLEKGANINELDNAIGFSPLVAAVHLDKYEVVKALVRKGADTSIETDRGETPLVIALEHQKGKALKALLDCGVDVNYKSATSKIALHSSVKCCSDEVTRLLISHGADVNAQDKLGNTALMFSSELSQCKNLMELLLKHDADVNIQSQNGSTALITATKSRNIESMDILIKNGADVNKSDSQGLTPLILASEICTTNMIDLLLKNGANVNAVDLDGSCVLTHAVKFSISATEKVTMLIEGGAIVNQSNSNGETPLMTAVTKCKSNIVNLLIEHGALLNTQDKNGSTALINAVDQVSDEHQPNVALLIEKGADLNIQNAKGYTALMIASQRGNHKAVKALVDAGADVHTVERHSGKNALSLTLSNFHFYSTQPISDSSGLACLEPLLKGGSKVEISEHNILFFHKLIISNNEGLVQLFVKATGVPHGFPVMDLRGYRYFIMKGPFIDRDIISNCKFLTPLCTAILNERTEIAQFFTDSWFFTEHDVKLQNSAALWKVFQSYRRRMTGMKDILDSVIFKPWSLARLSFVAVSAAIGTSQEREKRVKALPIPSVVQEKLLFRNNGSSLSGTNDGETPFSFRALGHLMFSSELVGMDEQD